MSDISTSMMNTLEKVLNLTSQRHSLIATNMANVDTPGYQTRDLNFREELVQAMNGNQAQFSPVARAVPGLMQRPDGNNVSLDREGLLLAETQMQYNLAIQLLRRQFQQVRTAINEGSKS